MPVQIDGRGDMNAFVLTSPLAGVMLLTRRQPFYPSAAHDKFHSICTAFGGYTEFGIVPLRKIITQTAAEKDTFLPLFLWKFFACFLTNFFGSAREIFAAPAVAHANPTLTKVTMFSGE